MADLISRKALLKELRRELRECRKDGEEFGGESILLAEGIESAIDTIKFAPSVDAVEVVRCKDCIQFMEYTQDYFGCLKEDCQFSEFADGDCRVRVLACNDAAYQGVKKNDFCSYGERKEKGE